MSRSWADQSAWRIERTSKDRNKEPEIAGVLRVYVDDLLVVGEAGLTQAVLEAVGKVWPMSKAEYIHPIEDGAANF